MADRVPTPCKVVGIAQRTLLLREDATGTDHHVSPENVTLVRRKLSDAEVMAFLADVSAGMSNKDACAKHGISESHGSAIARGRARRMAS